MSSEEIQMKCNELCGKSASELTSGFSRFYGDGGMWKSIRRIIQDMQLEAEMKAKKAYSDGRNKGHIEGVGGMVLACMIVGSAVLVAIKAKQSKERKAVWEENQKIREDIVCAYEEQLRQMKEAYEMGKGGVACQENHCVK